MNQVGSSAVDNATADRERRDNDLGGNAKSALRRVASDRMLGAGVTRETR